MIFLFLMKMKIGKLNIEHADFCSFWILWFKASLARHIKIVELLILNKSLEMPGKYSHDYFIRTILLVMTDSADFKL